MERQPEALLGEIEIVCLAQAAGDVAQRHHDALGVTYRHMNIGFEKDLVTVGMIEREHRAADRYPRPQFLPDIEQQRPISGPDQRGERLVQHLGVRTAGDLEHQLVGLDDAPLAVEHDHRIGKVVEQRT